MVTGTGNGYFIFNFGTQNVDYKIWMNRARSATDCGTVEQINGAVEQMASRNRDTVMFQARTSNCDRFELTRIEQNINNNY